MDENIIPFPAGSLKASPYPIWHRIPNTDYMGFTDETGTYVADELDIRPHPDTQWVHGGSTYGQRLNAEPLPDLHTADPQPVPPLGAMNLFTRLLVMAWDAGDSRGFRIWAQHHAIQLDKIDGDILTDLMDVRKEAGIV